MNAPEPRNRRRIAFALLGAAVAVGIVVFAARRERVVPIPLVLATETTFITGPVDAKGNLDYESAVNQHLKGQLRPGDNAVVAMLQVFGPKLERMEMLPEVYEWIDSLPPSEQGEYFVNYHQQFREVIPVAEASDFSTHVEELKRKPWKSQQEPLVAAWLTANAKPLERLAQASQKPHYFFPLVSKREKGSSACLVAALLPIAQPFREAAQVLSLRVALRCGEGRFDEAWDDVLTMHRIARQIAQGGTLIETLVGIAIETIGIQSAQLVLESSSPTVAKVMKWRESLEKLPPFQARLVEKISWCERLTCLNFVDLLRQGDTTIHHMLDPKDRELTSSLEVDRDRVDWNAVFRSINEHFNRLESAAKSKTRAERIAAFEAIEDDLRSMQRDQELAQAMSLCRKARTSLERADAGGTLGAAFARLLMPAISKVFDATDRLEQQQRHLELTLALTAYHADHQKYPVDLSVLVPKYTKTISFTAYSTSPPNYRLTANGFVLSCTGKNGKNETGEGLPTIFGGDDFGIAFQRR